MTETSVVGNYEVSVLAATNARALNQWLTENGYAGLPEGRGSAIADEYTKEHWRFVAAKLHRDGNGLSRPHPLMITFPAAAPVYPMRLTGLADSRLYLELYAIADGTASVPGMTCDFSDTFDRRSSKTYFLYDEREEYPLFSGKTSRMPFAMPALMDLMWPGCTLTKLSATVEPEQMGDDFRVEIGEPAFVQRHFFSNEGAMSVAILLGILFWGAAVAAGTIAWLKYQGRHEDKAHWLDDTDGPRAFFLVLILAFLMPLYIAIAASSLPIHDLVVHWQVGLAVLSALFAVYLAVFLRYASIGAPRVPRRKVLLPFAVLVCLLPFVGLVSTGLGTLVYLSLPKTEVQVSGFYDVWRVDFGARKLEEDAALLAGKSEAEIARIVDEKYPDARRHYDVLTDGKGIFVRVYESKPAKTGEAWHDIRIPQTRQPAETPPSPAAEADTPK